MTAKKLEISPYVGQDRVSIDWVYVGSPEDGMKHVVDRMTEIMSRPDCHFAGISVRWDGEHPRTMLCQIQYDDTGGDHPCLK